MSMALRHLASILMLPFVVTVLIPAPLIALTGTFNPGWGLPLLPGLLSGAAALGLMAGGVVLIITTVRLFATVGQGTLAPWDPTQRLVVTGIYRYVRNPMISGVMGALLGEALLSGSLPVLAWAAIFIIINLIYIPLVEEPGLYRRFGEDYREYVRHVPRWLLRRTPWVPPD